MALPQPDVTKTPHEQRCLDYWDNKRDDSINLQPGDDGYYHSHYSVVDFDRTVLDSPAELREERILKEMHRLENRQVELFIDLLGEISSEAHVIDNGCGRGGTSLKLHERHGCRVSGVDFSPYRLEFARRMAAEKGYAEHLSFRHANITDTPFPDGYFDYAVDNEVAAHVEDQQKLSREVSRVLKPGGRYAIAIWVANDPAAQRTEEIAAIDANYETRIPTRPEHLRALLDNDLVPLHIEDLTSRAIPYWELRSESAHRTGVEDPFLAAFSKRIMNYLFIVAERQ